MNIAPITPIELRAIERQSIDSQIKELTKRRDAIDAEILEVLADGKHVGNSLILEATTWSATDYEALAEAFPYESYPQLYSAKIDTAKVKDSFAPAALDSYKKYGKRSLKVKEV